MEANQAQVPVPVMPSSPIPPKRRRWVKALFILIGTIALLAAAFYFLPNIMNAVNGGDDPLVEHPELKLNVVKSSKEGNAYHLLVEASKISLVKPDGVSEQDLSNGKAWDQAKAEKYAQDNSDALALFLLASYSDYYQNPATADPGKYNLDTEGVTMVPWRELSRLSSIASEVLSRQGNALEAMEFAMANVRLGHMINSSQGDLLDYLVGNSIKLSGLQAMQKNLRYRKYSNEELVQFKEEFSKFRGNTDGLASAIKLEHYMHADTIDRLADDIASQVAVLNESGLSQRQVGSYYFKPNQSKNLMAELHSLRLSEIMDPQCKDGESHLLLNLNQSESLAKLQLLFVENAIGKINHDVISDALVSTVPKTRCMMDATEALLEAQLAMAGYANDNGGAYPNSLSGLVPMYMQSVPIDPYTASPLKHNPAKNTIYSVGTNFQDDQGTPGKPGDGWVGFPDLAIIYAP